MKTFATKRRAATILGLAIEPDRIEAVELRRTNGTAEVRRQTLVPLDSDPVDCDPEALGRTLRSHLDQAGIRESRCAVSLSPRWAAHVSLSVPDLPDADRKSFLELEAERGFARGPEDLLIRSSEGTTGNGRRFATIFAIEVARIHRLEAALHVAKLKPTSFGIGDADVAAAQSSDPKPALFLVPSGSLLVLLVRCGNAIVTLRTVEDAFLRGASNSDRHPDLDLILRELRITLGQLDSEIRESLRTAHVLGNAEVSRSFVSALSSRAQTLGLNFDLSIHARLEGLPFRLTSDPLASPALVAALLSAAGRRPALDFLPPRISPWRQFAARHASRRVAWAGTAVGAALALALLLFLGQQWILWRWQSRWDAMKSKVSQLESMQREVRRYDPWFDPSVRTLAILRRLTESFPEDGSVSAKSIEIRAPSKVACSGTARDPQAWLRMHDAIRNAPGVSDLKIEQLRGKSPIEFSFHFTWQPGNRS